MAATLSTPPPNQRLFEPDASIVLVGCRGAGKRSLGFIGALHLRRRLVTEDHYFEQVTGISRGQFLTRHGREAFTVRNAEVFKQMLDANRKRCIIECGMSSLAEDAQDALRAYSESHPVVYIHREREQILRFVDGADADQLLRADQSHRQCSNFEYYNLYDPYSGRSSITGSMGDSVSSNSGASSPWDHHQSSHNLSHPSGHPLISSSSRLLHAKEDFTRYLDMLQGQAWSRKWAESPFALNALPPEFRAYSYALRLRLSYLVDMDLEWEDFEARGDCVELIIDHWPDDLFDLIARQVALIRRKLSVPIIFHVEENPREERSRSLEERDRMDTELLELGLRLNVEYISLDLQRSDDLVRRTLAHRGHTRVIGNFWFPGLTAPQWSSHVHLDNYKRAQALGCDVVRIVRFCIGGPDGEPDRFRTRLAQNVEDHKPPLVAYEYSLLGIRVPLQGRILNPVKHPQAANRRDHLATVCTSSTALELNFQANLLDALQFFTIGSHIAYSITPAIVTAAFSFSGMPHTFQAAECATIDDLRALFLDPASPGNRTFGGATLAAPFKVAIRPYLRHESQHAAALGAVNVILPLRGGGQTASGPATMIDHANARNKAGTCSAFYGDNTDWRSIYKCLQRALSPRNVVQPSRTTALVIGAGGMARAAIYALIRLGCRHIFIHNRTTQHAVDIAQHFNEWMQTQSQQGHGAFLSSTSAATAFSTPSPSSSNHPATSGSNTSGSTIRVCHILTSAAEPWPAEYQPPTMIISCVPTINIDGSPAADFEMPRQWLTSPTGGVVVELAYEPLITPLVAQMQLFRDTVSPAWVIVDGLEVVSEMAIEAFELMTGRMAPQRLMRSVCRQSWQGQQQEQGVSVTPSSFAGNAMTDGP